MDKESIAQIRIKRHIAISIAAEQMVQKED